MKCSHGYTGKLKFDSTSSTHYIYQCDILANCVQKFYPGLVGILNQVVSCHECELGKYPIIFVNGGVDVYQGFLGYNSYDPDKTIDQWKDVSSTKGYTMYCE